MNESGLRALSAIDRHFLDTSIRAEEMAALAESMDLTALSDKLRAFDISYNDRGRALMAELRELGGQPRTMARDLRANDIRDQFEKLTVECTEFYDNFGRDALVENAMQMMTELLRRQSKS